MKRLSFFSFFCLLMLFVSCWENIQDRMERECKEFTQKKCPRQLDDFTVLDSMVFKKSDVDKGETLLYHSFDISEDDLFTLTEKQDSMRIILLNNLINDVYSKRAKEEGCKFTFLYRWKQDGKIKFKFTFTKDEYR